MQVVGLGVMWRTYDLVSHTSDMTRMHEYQIKEEIRPELHRLRNSIYPYGSKIDPSKSKPPAS